MIIWELWIFVVLKETEIYADLYIPIHQAYSTLWNIFKYHCIVVKHRGKVQHWNCRTFCTMGDNWSMFFCACNNQTWRRFRFGRRIYRTYNAQYFFWSENISLCLFFLAFSLKRYPPADVKQNFSQLWPNVTSAAHTLSDNRNSEICFILPKIKTSNEIFSITADRITTKFCMII